MTSCKGTVAPRDAVALIIQESGVKQSEVSVGLGHAASYIAQMKSHDYMPKVSTLVRVANACGFRLMLESVDGSVRHEIVEGH